MLRERHINGDTGRRPGLASAGPVRMLAERLVWIVEQRFLWRAADLFRALVQIGRRPLERLVWLLERVAWPFERRLVWPLQERAADWDLPGRAVGAGALAAIGLTVGVLAVVSTSGGESARPQAAVPTRAVIASAPAPPPAPSPPKPALQGATPSFGVPASGGDGSSGASATKSSSEQTGGADVGGEADEGGDAAASRAKPVPAGPVAMRVARRFAEAFVFYEIGQRPARARTVFGETATPRLATALAERPPRLPEKAKVPQARVLNLVAGPRRGKAYTVSVSLLRVGVTSELRLEMKKQNGAWLVTDVRG